MRLGFLGYKNVVLATIYDYESDMWHWIGAGFLGWHISDGVVWMLTFSYIIGLYSSR